MTHCAQIAGSQVHLVESAAVGDTFEISILKPEGIEGPLPVIYATNANNSFGAAANAVAMMTLRPVVKTPSVERTRAASQQTRTLNNM